LVTVIQSVYSLKPWWRWSHMWLLYADRQCSTFSTYISRIKRIIL